MSDFVWSISVPANSATIGSLPGHHRDTRERLASRLDIEHTTIVSGTNQSNSGGQHRSGSALAYFQASSPSTRPGDGTVNLDGNDSGRIWIDTDDGNSLWVWDGSAFASVTISGVGTGTDVAILAGRAGGQTLLGGTGSGDALNLGGSSHADEGPINILAADTTLINLNNVPVQNLTLDNNQRIANVGDPTTEKDAIPSGRAIIVKADISSSGSIAFACHGTVVGVGSAVSADVGFAPDFVLGWNAHNEKTGLIWTRDSSALNKKFTGGTGVTEITVTGSVISFADGSFVNKSETAMFYLAIKTNKTVNPV